MGKASAIARKLPVFRMGKVQSFFQKFLLAASLFMRNELLYHAAATAFFFLLSVTPIFLLLLLTFDDYLASFPGVADNFFAFLKNLSPNMDRDFLVRIGLLNVKTKAAGAIGIFNLVWAGCWILTAIQKGLEIVFKSQQARTTLVMTVLSLSALIILLGLAFLAAITSIGLNLTQAAATVVPFWGAVIGFFIPILKNLLPFLSAFLAVFFAYRYVPRARPSTRSSLGGALGCTLTVIMLHILMARFMTVTRFNLIYGVLGSLIMMLLWVHFTLVLFYFFAEYTYVSDNIDSLAIGRMYLLRSGQAIRGNKIERFLFKHPRRIVEKYARRYNAGETVFPEGERGCEIYYVYKGRVRICHKGPGSEQRIATIDEGEIFGEMAYLLNESRMATAVSDVEATLLILSPEIFEELLQVNQQFARDVIRQLSNRLRKLQLPEIP